MKIHRLLAACFLLVLLFSAGVFSKPGGPPQVRKVRARMIGFREVPANVTPASGTFEAKIDQTAQTITYTESFTNLEGATTASHIHIAQPDVSGGVSAFLCGGGSKPACPASGTLTGTIGAADVVGPTAQEVDTAAFTKLVPAI